MTIPNMSRTEFRNVLQDHTLDSALLDNAIEQTEQSHKGQFRDNGNPSLTEHVYPVAYQVIKSYGSLAIPVHVVVSALLHDCIEDDPHFTYKRCEDRFGKQIAGIVQALTKSDAENVVSNNQEEKARLNRIYMQRLAGGPHEAMLIKLADRYCNLATIKTIKDTNPGKYNRYISETRDLFLPLAKAYSAYFYNQLDELLHSLESLE